MRLAIDATPILPGGKGLAIVFETLLDCLDRSGAMRPAVVYVDESFFDHAKQRWPRLPLTLVHSRPALLWEKIRLPKQVMKDGIELLFTGRDRTICEPRCKTVIYLFEIPDYRNDMILKGVNGWYSKAAAISTQRSFGSVARTVTHFIVSSESTRRDLMTRYRVPAEKLTVVYPGLRPRFCGLAKGGSNMEARQHFTGGKPYVLHFATGDPRDNSSTALTAFSRAAPHLGQDMMLLLVGSGVKAMIDRGAARNGLAGRVCHAGFLSDDELVLAYHGAEAYLDPTLYEGFGLQLIEAMACGVPVLSSRVTSVPEVVGEAGMLFDPYDIDGFASGLVELAENPDRRKTMIAKGLARAKLFSWDNAVKQIANVVEAHTIGCSKTSTSSAFVKSNTSGDR